MHFSIICNIFFKNLLCITIMYFSYYKNLVSAKSVRFKRKLTKLIIVVISGGKWCKVLSVCSFTEIYLFIT